MPQQERITRLCIPCVGEGTHDLIMCSWQQLRIDLEGGFKIIRDI